MRGHFHDAAPMIGKLISWLGPHRPPLPDLFRPRQPIAIIGDIHGRLDLLHALLDLINQQPAAGVARLIFVGDLLDRGPDSAGVLDRLYGLCKATPDRAICLCGNHERMFLDFLSDPAGQGRRWLNNGGSETLASLGLGQRVQGETPAARLEALAEAVRAALPAEQLTWLSSLPLYWQEGNLAVVHASADPGRAMADQAEQALLWGHPGFGKTARKDGLWIAHGHVIVPQAGATEGRIAVDTGAWRTGRLSAAWLDGDGLRFLEATAG